MESYRRADPVSFIDRETACLSKSQQDLQKSAKKLAGMAGVIDRPGRASELPGDNNTKLMRPGRLRKKSRAGIQAIHGQEQCA